MGRWSSPLPKSPWPKITTGMGSGWLVTQAPVSGGETFAIRFAIWETGDQALATALRRGLIREPDMALIEARRADRRGLIEHQNGQLAPTSAGWELADQVLNR